VNPNFTFKHDKKYNIVMGFMQEKFMDDYKKPLENK